MIDIAAATPENSHLTTLRGRIGWICQTIRALVIGFAVADLFAILAVWADRESLERHYRGFLKIDLSGASTGQFAIGLALNLVVWVFVAVTCFCLWRVFSLYLRGSIFSAESALWLRRAGILGFFTVLVDIGMRSAIILVLAAHLPANQNHGYVRLDDLLYVIFTLMIIAVAQIFKTAAEIAGEHAQFV